MYTLWVIAKAHATGSPLAAALVGNHAVRLFASVASFVTLARSSGRVLPDGIVVDLDDAAMSAAAVSFAIESVIPGIPVVMVTADPVGWDAKERAVVIARASDTMALEAAVTASLTKLAPQSRRVFRFKNLVLDLDALRLRCGADELGELPPKEAQILRLFIEKPGTCLSRQEIAQALWQYIKVTPRTIDSHVSRLRKRLTQAEVSIESVYGDGYILR